MQERFDLNPQASPPIACKLLQIFSLLGRFDDVRLAVLKLVEVFELVDSAILFGFGHRLIFTCELNFPQNEASIHDRVTGAEHSFFDVGWVHVVVPTDHILLSFMVNVNDLLTDVLVILRRSLVRRPRHGAPSQAEEVAVVDDVRGLLGRCRSCSRRGSLCSWCGLHCSWRRRRRCCRRRILPPGLRHGVKLIQGVHGDQVVVTALLCTKRFDAAVGIYRRSGSSGSRWAGGGRARQGIERLISCGWGACNSCCRGGCWRPSARSLWEGRRRGALERVPLIVPKEVHCGWCSSCRGRGGARWGCCGWGGGCEGL
mmetsp:Transcript_16961/g.36746  ORF Transcript_16961/g.36746 Transcript_16961/m.36746 type:complete len:314 (-) Transcript_16961:610-1551(-)